MQHLTISGSNYKINNFDSILEKIIKLSPRNIKIFLIKLEIFILSGKIKSNLHTEIVIKILDLCFIKNLNNLLEIKNITQCILKKEYTLIFKEILKQLEQKSLTDEFMMIIKYQN